MGSALSFAERRCTPAPLPNGSNPTIILKGVQPMSITTDLTFRVNLDEALPASPCQQLLMAGDQQAHRFTISCYRNHFRESVDLTDAKVHGYFVLNGKETLLLEGTTSGNAATLTLPAACYALACGFSLVIKLRLADVVHTVLWYQGKVCPTSTDEVIDPGQVLPALDELLAQIDLLEQTTTKATAVANMTAEAHTLPADSPATAEFSGGKLTLGIPKGRDSEIVPPVTSPNMALITDPSGKMCWEERTHYDYSGGTVLPLTDLAVVGGYATFREPFGTLPQAGTPYKVTYLGFEYECTGIATEADGKPCVVIGNESHMGSGLNTQEPFIFVFYNPEDVTDGIYGWFSCLATDKSTIPVSIVGNGELKKIDKKFLPDDIGGMPEGGAPFQQLVTDGEGNTVWADRLAYEDPDMMTVILPQTTLFPSDEDGDGLSDAFALIVPPSAPLIEGETYIVTYNGEVFECKAKNFEGVIGLGNMAPFAAAEDTGEPFAFVVLSEELIAEINSGVYGMAIPLDGADSVTLSVVKKGGYKTIEPRFLPEGIGYEEEGAVVSFLPSPTLVVNDGAATGDRLLNNHLLHDLVVGKFYTVTHNGTPYELALNAVPMGDDEGRIIYYFGNLALLEFPNIPDTGEPFLLWNVANTAGTQLACVGMQENDTVEIAGRVSTVHTIPEKYLPNAAKPVKLYISSTETTLNDTDTHYVYKDEACTKQCTYDDLDELVDGRPFVVMMYFAGMHCFMQCAPLSYAFMNMADGRPDTIGVVLSCVNSYKAVTKLIYLRFIHT